MESETYNSICEGCVYYNKPSCINVCSICNSNNKYVAKNPYVNLKRKIMNGDYGTSYVSEVINMNNKTDSITITCGSIYPSIKNVIFNPPATIVFWGDGAKTVVKCSENDIFDPEKGLAMAISKKFIGGNEGRYFNEFKKWAKKYEEPESVDSLSRIISNIKLIMLEPKEE